LEQTARNKIFVLPPGRYSNLPGEEFIGNPISLSQQRISLGTIDIVTVRQGEVGISYLSGQLIVLPTGQHILKEAYHTFERFVSLKRENYEIR